MAPEVFTYVVGSHQWPGSAHIVHIMNGSLLCQLCNVILSNWLLPLNLALRALVTMAVPNHGRQHLQRLIRWTLDHWLPCCSPPRRKLHWLCSGAADSVRHEGLPGIRSQLPLTNTLPPLNNVFYLQLLMCVHEIWRYVVNMCEAQCLVFMKYSINVWQVSRSVIGLKPSAIIWEMVQSCLFHEL